MTSQVGKSPNGALRRIMVLAASALALSASSHRAVAAPVGLQHEVILTGEAPLANGSELLRRLLTPLAAAEVRRLLARSGKTLSEQSINLADERFVVYVPATPPPRGYGVLVFVPPWREAALPDGWAPVLDRYGMIYVSAARSGNDENVFGRREPLALAAAQAIARLYPTDPERIYVGGFSGGSRVAMRLALAYPDLFRGALLNAGSDPLGEGQAPLPPRELFSRFQAASRLVYVTGGQDTLHLQMDAASLKSMRQWCVFDVEDQVTPFAGHEPAAATALARALEALARHVPADEAKRAACRAAVEGELKVKLDQARALIADGKRDKAHKLLLDIDRRFGGLAAPASVDLAGQ